MGGKGNHHLAQTPPTASIFEQFSDADVLALIAEYPLAWVTPENGDSLAASLLPLVAHKVDGKLVHLVGHLARSNPLAQILQTQRKATLLFCGPQDYVSPALVSQPRWAPTWNYAQLRIEAEILCDTPEIGEALQQLTDVVEDGNAPPWQIAQMGDRYHGMSRAIMSFTCIPKRLEGRFKLGQDENHATLNEILTRHPNGPLVAWMKRLNAGRLFP